MNGRTFRQLLIFAGIQLAVTLALFPERFGTGLAEISAATLLLELVYYGVMSYLLLRAESVSVILKSAFSCLVYRAGMSFIFAVLASAFYSMNFGNAMELGFGAYIPGLLLLSAPAPFLLQGFLKEMFGGSRRRFEPQTQAVPGREYDQNGRATIVLSKAGAQKPAAAPASLNSSFGNYSMETVASPSDRLTDMYYQAPTAHSDANGFERAVRYVCEDSSVKFAAVVDSEGLMLSQCHRGAVDPEQWAPFACELLMYNNSVLMRGGWQTAEKLDLTLPDARLAIARADEQTCLLVVAERHGDDVLHIRITQALDIIRKYVSERYSQRLSPNAEKYHVSSTQ
jgi:hypothetical protein